MTRDQALAEIMTIRMSLVDLAVDLGEWRQGAHVVTELNAMQVWLDRICTELKQEDQ